MVCGTNGKNKCTFAAARRLLRLLAAKLLRSSRKSMRKRSVELWFICKNRCFTRCFVRHPTIRTPIWTNRRKRFWAYFYHWSLSWKYEYTHRCIRLYWFYWIWVDCGSASASEECLNPPPGPKRPGNQRLMSWRGFPKNQNFQKSKFREKSWKFEIWNLFFKFHVFQISIFQILFFQIFFL